MYKDIAIGYHLKSLTSLKQLFGELKDYSKTNNINSILCLNDELSSTVHKARKYYDNYISKFSFSKDAVELYVSFVTNVLVLFYFKSNFINNLYIYIMILSFQVSYFIKILLKFIYIYFFI